MHGLTDLSSSTVLTLLSLVVAGTHPSCYDVRVDAPGHKVPVLSFRSAATRPGKGDVTCSLVPLRHADNAISVREGKSESFAVTVYRPNFHVKAYAQLAQQYHTIAHCKLGMVAAWSCSGVLISSSPCFARVLAPTGINIGTVCVSLCV